MTTRINHEDERQPLIIGLLLLLGIVLAGLSDAFTGTALSFGKLDMWGDLYTTSDEFALLDVGYTAAKLCGFMLVPALFARFKPLRVMQTAVAVLAGFNVVMVATTNLYPLVLFRVLQGMAGGVVLVSGQTMLFNVFSKGSQPVTQLCFAFGAVVFPATFVSYFQGWMVDTLSWEAIFATAAGLGVAAMLWLFCLPVNIMASSGPKRADIPGLILFVTAAVCLTYIAQEGSRWNWFEADHITALTVGGFAALLAFILRWALRPCGNSIVAISVFRDPHFCFGFTISFVAGVALFGSTWLIPGFSLNIAGMTATEAGALIASGGFMFILALAVTAFLLRVYHMPPMATIPLGILLVMAGLWMLSGSTSESGSADLLPALLVRGAGLGFLFLSLTIYALSGLEGSRIAQGVALFITNRQFGGLFGVAVLQRYLDHQNALNGSVLSAHLDSGSVLLSERLNAIQAVLQSRGMEAGEAAKAAMAFLKKSLGAQGGTLSYNEAFFAVLFVVLIAAPLLLSFDLWLAKRHPANIAVHTGK
jgi:DHA2 family multidrug resistance protein